MNRIKLFLSILVSSLILISCSNSAGGISGSPNGSATQPQVPSNTKYSITLAEINAGGSAVLNKTRATAGETVTVTYSADAEQHYTIGTISVTSGKQAVSYTDNSGVVTFKMPAGNVIVNISFKLIKKTVTFNLNGGSGVNSVSADYGTAISVPDAPEKENYRFVAWYSDSSLKNKYDFSTQVIEDFELYAKWQYTGALASKGFIKNSNAANDEEKYYANTEEIYVMPENKAAYINITKEASWCIAYEYLRGVFRAGRKVKLSPFIMGKHEVTKELYSNVIAQSKLHLNSMPSGYDIETRSNPVVNITWYDAVYFCNLLTELKLGKENQVYTISSISISDKKHIQSADVKVDITKTGYRLPTEAEWEFAARGGDPSQEDWNYKFSGNAVDCTYNVSKNTNVLGLVNMSGDEAEWCYDWYESDPAKNDDKYKQNGYVVNPLGETNSGLEKVIRGGVYSRGSPDSSYSSRNCSVGYRNRINQNIESECVGFRIVRTCPAE